MRIDLRSDTLTKPSKKMLEAIVNASVGDDVYKEDETVNLLEKKVCDYFGTEAALFFPTGTMANQAAIKLHTQPGEQLICHEWAHVYNYEGGGVSFNSGVSCKLLPGKSGLLSAKAVEEAINPPDFYHSPLTRLVCVENTTNKGGGACYTYNNLKEIKQVCKKHQLKYHLDGARLWNALVAKKENPKQYADLFDTISVCFSKGLGAPMGTVLTGTAKSLSNAMRVRKVLGGGMRQIGYMAAACLYALENNINRLAEDHQKASEISRILSQCSFVEKVEPCETNIIIFSLQQNIDELVFMKQLEKQDIHISAMGKGKLRIVTHLDYTQEQHDRFCSIVKKL